MPYVSQEDKAKYMQRYFTEVIGRVFTFIVSNNFTDDKKQINKLIAVANKYNVQFYFVWHDTHMQSVVYSPQRRTPEQILNILKEAELDVINDIVFIGRTLSVELRYLLHLDDPNKTQYSPDDFVLVGNADPLDRIVWAKEELEVYVNEIADYAESNCITSARALQRYIDKSRIYKFVYRKQAYKQDIDNIIIANRDNAHHTEQVALLTQIAHQQAQLPYEDAQSVSEDFESVSDNTAITIRRTAEEIKEIAKHWREIEVKRKADSWRRAVSKRPLSEDEKYIKMLKDSYDPLREQALLIEVERLVA